MSSSDLTEKNKLESICNKLNTKDASNKTLKKKINNIRCIDVYDSFGNIVDKSWFNIIIPPGEFTKEFPPAEIILDSSSNPPVVFPVTPATSIVDPQDGKTIKMLGFNRQLTTSSGALFFT